MEMSAVLNRIFDTKLRSARKAALASVKEAKKLVKRAGDNVSEGQRAEVLASVQVLSLALAKDDVAVLNKEQPRLEALLERYLAMYRKPAWRESFEQIAVAVFVALLLRAFIVEAFKIPSGSMIPTLAIGDQIFVNKYIYGVRVPFTAQRIVDFAMPERGEVVVFIVPIEPHEDYIKRVIGLPGDEIEVRRGTIYLNGKAVPRKSLGQVTETDRDAHSGRWLSFEAQAYEETLGDHTYTVLRDANTLETANDFGPYTVPEGHVFVMGDDRDRSYDSRRWQPGGQSVPLNNILGRAMFIWWSWGKDGLDTSRLGTWID